MAETRYARRQRLAEQREAERLAALEAARNAESAGALAPPAPPQAGGGPDGMVIDRGQPQDTRPPLGAALATPMEAAQSAGEGPTVGDQDAQSGVAKEQMGKVLDDTTEAVKTASDQDAKRVTEQLEDTTGVDINTAYEELIEKMGGFREVDKELPKHRRGLFLLDFGMRLMAASNSWDAQLGGAVGTAGLGAMDAQRQRDVSDQASVDQYNQQLHGRATDLMGEQRAMGAEQREMGALLPPESTTEGLYQPRKYDTGQPPVPMTGEGGGILKEDPLSRRGSNRPLQVQVLRQWYQDLGYGEEESIELATGARNTLRSVQDYVDFLTQLKGDKPNRRLTTVGGERKKLDDWETEDITAEAVRMHQAVRSAAGQARENMREGAL